MGSEERAIALDEPGSAALEDLAKSAKNRLIKRIGIKKVNRLPKFTKKYTKRPSKNKKAMIKQSKKMNRKK